MLISILYLSKINNRKVVKKNAGKMDRIKQGGKTSVDSHCHCPNIPCVAPPELCDFAQSSRATPCDIARRNSDFEPAISSPTQRF